MVVGLHMLLYDQNHSTFPECSWWGSRTERAAISQPNLAMSSSPGRSPSEDQLQSSESCRGLDHLSDGKEDIGKKAFSVPSFLVHHPRKHSHESLIEALHQSICFEGGRLSGVWPAKNDNDPPFVKILRAYLDLWECPVGCPLSWTGHKWWAEGWGRLC